MSSPLEDMYEAELSKLRARVAELEGALDRIEQRIEEIYPHSNGTQVIAGLILCFVREERARLSGEPQPTPEPKDV